MGGTFVKMNKVVPGAYINFVSVKPTASQIGSRGVATLPLVLPWGKDGELIEVLSEDLATGLTADLVGLTLTDSGVLQLRECLKKSYKCLVYKINTGGVKASVSIGDLDITALYTGTYGNNISVKVVDNTTSFDVVPIVGGVVKDTQNVTAIADLVDNDFVEFAGVGVLTADAGTSLIGGTDGTVSTATYTTYMNLLKTKQFQTVGFPTNADIVDDVIDFVTDMREVQGQKIQAVVYNDNSADYEGVIAVKQGYKTATETISAIDFVAYVTGLTAGTPAVAQEQGQRVSNTNLTIEDAIEVVNPLTNAEIEEQVQLGWFLLKSLNDGSVVTVRDINTLVTFTTEKSSDFARNRVLRTLDEIASYVTTKFEKNYIGKVDNTPTGRAVFRGELAIYFNRLRDDGAILDFDSQSDLLVEAGEEIDSVVVYAYVKPVEAMEKLYMTVFVK